MSIHIHLEVYLSHALGSLYFYHSAKLSTCQVYPSDSVVPLGDEEMTLSMYNDRSAPQLNTKQLWQILAIVRKGKTFRNCPDFSST
jgi:hypothetical protein